MKIGEPGQEAEVPEPQVVESPLCPAKTGPSSLPAGQANSTQRPGATGCRREFDTLCATVAYRNDEYPQLPSGVVRQRG
jgi:hypothetical protein